MPHDPKVPIGAMIETPSAALTADHIAVECDFLSVGTNDLIQDAFAADRQNEEMTFLYQPLHPAILRARPPPPCRSCAARSLGTRQRADGTPWRNPPIRHFSG
jgi:hypothetical protein